MALNTGAVGKTGPDCTERGDPYPEGGEPHKNSATTSAIASQNGDQPGCRDSVMPEQEAPERRRSVQGDARSCSGSPSPTQRSSEELPRRNFQIPRKTRERKGLYQFLPPDSREFEELVKIISSFYLDSSSRATFTYSKARLIHNELLEKEFIEKRREMKQEGRTDQELAESYCFLFPDKSKLPWICEKGLSVGHCRITTLGNPSVGVYLSKYSDLLQINPFEVGSFGDMIIFKVMRGRVKHIHENMPKNAIEPSPKFDCHLSKIANRVTSLLSYRAFELTQQYFFEFAFDEIKARPRNVCPYAVVSFQYKGKEAAGTPLTAHRFNAIPPEGSRGKSCYTVWSGPLLNKDQELFPICLRSFSRPYLPFRLPEKLDMSRGMQLEQVKRKIPSVLFSWDTYSSSREVMKCGMSCSLFEVADGKGKLTNGSLAALISKLERDRMVLVKPLFDRGFLFLLSSTQMLESKERWARTEKKLQALFIFQESRMVVKFSSRFLDPEPLTVEPQPAILSSVEPFIPALHFSLFKLRPNPGKDLSSGVERQAGDYLARMDTGTVRPFILPDYKNNLDERTSFLPPPRPKFNMDAVLRSYTHNPANHIVPLSKVKDMIERIRNPVPAPVAAPVASLQPAPAQMEYSPVSDWGGSDKGSDRAERPADRPSLSQLLQAAQMRSALETPSVDASKHRSDLTHSNGAQPQTKALAEAQPQKARGSQSEYDKDKMKQLLKLIQLHKKTLVKEPGKERGEDALWEVASLKRKFEGDERMSFNKHQRTDHLSNGEPSRGFHADDIGEEVAHSDNLTAVMESMGIYDTDLRTHGNANASAVNETQRLLKILLATLNKAVSQGPAPPQANHGEPSKSSGRGESLLSDPDIGKQAEPMLQTNYAEEDMDCSPGSPCSVGSPAKQMDSSDIPTASVLNEAKEEFFPAFVPDTLRFPESHPPARSSPEPQPTAPLNVKTLAPPPLPLVDEAPSRPSISLDTILNQEIHSLSSDIKSIMRARQICYSSKLPPRFPLRHCWQPHSSFSNYVVPYVSPVSVQCHVESLREKMDKLIPPRPAHISPKPPGESCRLTAPTSIPVSNSKLKTEPSLTKDTTFSRGGKGVSRKDVSVRVKKEPSLTDFTGEVYSPSQVTSESPERTSQNSSETPAGGPNLLAGSFIGQLKPEVFSSLVEIFKDVTKNTVKFFIYSGEERDESIVCKEIKEYLKSLGNAECNPQMFLENSGSLDKLLIIIRNEDIAAHVHKIPALVSLKKLPSVSFAGVDSLDDVKNHTYNELFVSGGFIVSDEFILNPDLITQERLQGLLKFLEERSTPEHPWQWKVHCKSQKKLKELGRLNSNAMGLLNLLTAYQKKHLVEFLPYHECDAPSRQAPDLECLIKLQAQHTQQRHLLFLTERPFEMFLQYSRNGIVIASIDDVMSGFHSLIGSISQNELPTPPSTVVNDDFVEAEDMSLDSDDGEPAALPDTLQQVHDFKKDTPPLPLDTGDFRPPLPDHETTSDKLSALPDSSSLKTAISQFKATNQLGLGSADMGSLSPGGFPVNPHQSFLCPSTPWSSYAGPCSYAASPAYPGSPCGSTHEQEYRSPAAASAVVPPPPALTPAGPLTAMASLPLEVKPPPPPHLIMLGQTFGSETAGSHTSGNSPLKSSLPFTNHGDPTPPAFMATVSSSGNPPLLDRTLGGPEDGLWGVGETSEQAASSQGELTSAPVDSAGPPQTEESLQGGTAAPQGGRTQVNCADHRSTPMGIPPPPTRGSSVPRPKMPPHPIGGYGGRGGILGQMDHGHMRGGMGPGSLGHFRGRGAPPVGHWPRPSRGHELRDGPCSWGHPSGRGGPPNYYMDYSYSHNYAPE